MTRKLINLCLVLTLVAGCAGSALAAAVCPHAGCETMTAAPENADAHCDPAPAETHHAAGAHEHSSHAESQHGHATRSAAEERHGTETKRPASKHSRGVASPSHDTTCAHCSGRRESPPSAKFEWQPNSIKRHEKESPPQHAVGYSAPPSRGFARQITPAQHAPPAQTDRHVLLGVFRI
ncbi:MAG TPA: hypothetical protein VER32_10305 [Pyrinomonadaceae bacterium]|nr:hypothetical protein [Pyrinomonadaceae bacterium]